MRVIVTYDGYALEETSVGGYRSMIDGDMLRFDTAGQWKQFIDRRRNEKTSRKTKDRSRLDK